MNETIRSARAAVSHARRTESVNLSVITTYCMPFYDSLRGSEWLEVFKTVNLGSVFDCKIHSSHFSINLSAMTAVCVQLTFYRLVSELHEMFLDIWLLLLANFTDWILRTFNSDVTKHYDEMLQVCITQPSQNRLHKIYLQAAQTVSAKR